MVPRMFKKRASVLTISAALRIIYGIKKSYATLTEESGVETLKERRCRLINKFILKTSNNPRFSEDWFPKKIRGQHDLRNDRKYVEMFARTERLYRRPIYFYRRHLNDLTANRSDV